MDKYYDFQSVIIQIEEKINYRQAKARLNENGALLYLDPEKKKRIEEALEKRNKDETAVNYVFNKLREKQEFLHDDGQVDCAKFYKHARISPDVWSTFISDLHNIREDTQMKIIIGLALTEEEAVEFLSLVGTSFSTNNPLHRVILACIDCEFYDPDLVYDILEYYIEIYYKKNEGKKCKPFRNIYK